jgi:pyruvate/2-oxoglutarate dehydrogenase complex dihydrolipoamide dehydrogenase (E3) component
MGARVTLVDGADRLLPRDDPEAGAILAGVFESEGIGMHLDDSLERVELGIRVTLASGAVLDAERLLIATGRRAAVAELGLEQLGVAVSAHGIEVDE